MKKINQILFTVFLSFFAILCLTDILLSKIQVSEKHNVYRISINRIEKAITEFEQTKERAVGSLNELLLFAGVEEYKFVTKLIVLEKGKQEREEEFWKNELEEYIVIVSKYAYYKIIYVTEDISNPSTKLIVKGVEGIWIILFLLLLIYVRQKVLLPFHQFSQLPYELSKGNLTIPLKENKNKLFGKFIWGMELLREYLEENKERELELQKEKKLLLLSLSHDMKTPLSAIQLYAQALCKNLYQEEAKKQEIAQNIQKKAKEMEGYIVEIIRASKEDFLHFQVNNTEVYTRDVLEQIWIYYKDKMYWNQIKFTIGKYPNCFVWGDADRIVEVIQNVIENAIKYGDGKSIEINVTKSEEEYIISIRNTGCTLSQKELPHIFDSFFRGSNIERNLGSGLGLYICRQLMYLMEGGITATIEETDKIMEVNIILHLV